jgi:regulatory protein
VSEATELALRALRHRERSREDLVRRLDRAGIAVEERERALDALAEAGLLSDERFAETRARALAERSAGDELIRGDLAGHGIDEAAAEAAIAALAAEAERAARVYARRGGGPKALRYLAAKGFSGGTLETLGTDGLH